MTKIKRIIETLKKLKEEPTLNARHYIRWDLDEAIKYLEEIDTKQKFNNNTVEKQ